MFLQELIKRMLPTFPKDFYIVLLHSFFQSSKLDLKWKSIYEIEMILRSECDYGVKIAASCYLSSLEKEMVEFELINSQALGVDVKTVITNQEQEEQLKELLTDCCIKNMDFWKELLADNPSGNKLQELGFKITIINDQIRSCFSRMQSKNNNNIRTLKLYGNYIHLVLNDHEESKRILLKAENMQSLSENQQFFNDKRIRFKDNIDQCIVVASGNMKSMGTIKSINLEACRFLELSNESIIGENVDTLMPKKFAENHLG